jgi:hypothetical protein
MIYEIILLLPIIIIIPLGLLLMLFWDKAYYLPSYKVQLIKSTDTEIISKYRINSKKYEELLTSINILNNTLTKLQLENTFLIDKQKFVN